MALTGSGTSEKSEIARPPQAKRWVVALTLLIVGLPAAWNISSWPTRLSYRGELSGIDGMRLAEMQHLRRGVPIYAPASPKRFDAAIYGPLYYLLGARVVNLDKLAFLPFRLIAMLGTLGCAAGCGLLAFWLSRTYLSAALSTFFYFSYQFVTLHGLSARSDTVALFLVFSGFLVAYCFQSSPRLLWAAPAMLGGLFYKQQYISAPVAVFIFLLLERRYRRAAQYVALMALGGLGLLLLFQYSVFAGQDFFLHVFMYNLVSFDWSLFQHSATIFLVVLIVPMFVGFEFLRRHPNKLVACYLLCTILFTLILWGKKGSGTNYYLEPILILSCLFGPLLAEGLSEQSRSVELLVLLGVALFLGDVDCPPGPSREDFRRDQAIQDFLRQSFPPGTKALGHYTGDLVRAGLEAPISDLWQLSALIKNGRLSDAGLAAQIRRRRFGVIVLTYDLQSTSGDEESIYVLDKRLQRAVLENYHLAVTMPLPRPEMLDDYTNRFDAWVPRPGPQAADRSLPCD